MGPSFDDRVRYIARWRTAGSCAPHCPHRRPLAVDGRVFTAGTGERYRSGGAIAWTDPATGVTGVFRKPFEFLPVTAIKALDGGRKLAGSTWVALHSGKHVPQPREATVMCIPIREV